MTVRPSNDAISKSRSVTVAGGKRSTSPGGRFSTVNGGDAAVRWKLGTVTFNAFDDVDAAKRQMKGKFTTRLNFDERLWISVVG